MTTLLPSPLTYPNDALADQALSPLDGRYREQTAPLAAFLSEGALNQARLHVEVEWLLFIAQSELIPGVPSPSADDAAYLRSFAEAFTPTAQHRLAELERETRHDVKAVEYLLRERLLNAPAGSALPKLVELVHVFCTSEDINNLSYALCVKGALEQVWRPAAETTIDALQAMAVLYQQVPMLSRTHGQSATPTTLGKELAVFVYRFQRQLRNLDRSEFLGKLNGATGTFSAHVVALPQADWPALSRRFVESLGLTWNPLTTQIDAHDWQAEIYSTVAHINRIAHNLATDCWTYISQGYFHQDLSAHGTTGSSTMPHKVNPIRFENAEANLELSSALFDTLSQTLTTSRLQRDLTDSTTQRNIGVAFGYSLLAFDNLNKGLAGIAANQELLATDLDNHWEVISEAIQQVLRVEAASGRGGVDSPYEQLKALTRGEKVTAEKLREFIATLPLEDQVRTRLLELTPSSYVGVAANLVDFATDPA